MAVEHEGDGRRGRVPRHRQILAFARRTLQELANNRSALFWGAGMPVFFFLLFGVAGSGGGDGSPEEAAAVAVAFGVFGVMSVTLVVFAQTFADDLRVRRYRKLRSMPISPGADLLGRFLGGFALAFASFSIVLLTGAIFGARYTLRSPLSPVIVLLALFLFALIGTSLAVLVATTMTGSGYVVAASNVLLLGLYFLTGYNGISPDFAPGPLGEAVNLAPNSLATRITIYHLGDVGESPEMLSPPPLPAEPWYVGLLVLWAVGFVVAGSVVLDRGVYRGDGGE